MRTTVQWARAHPGVMDTLLVVVLILPLVPFVLRGDGGPTGELHPAYQILTFVPLAWRRRAPVAAFAGVSLLLAGQVLLNDVPLYSDVAFLFAMYAIAAYGPTWARRGALGVAVLGAILAAQDWYVGSLGPTQAFVNVVGFFLAALAPWAVGAYMRTRRDYVAGLVDRAAQLERDAAQQAQLAAAAERARIAREMHDVVAHSLSVIVVQADGALYASRERPEVAAQTLETISQTSRRSLAEMRRLLGLLRDEDGTPPADGEEVSRAPMPTAADVPELVATVRRSGLDVRAEITGDLARIDAAAGLTVYRVVQEALTNTLKHGGVGAHALVTVRVGEDDVAVRVVDDGGRAPAPGNAAAGSTSTIGEPGGHGIVGIRERIAIHAGSVEAGPLLDGGFGVSARIPYGEPR